MSDVQVKKRRGWPRWWRRMQVTARRANFFVLMEAVAAAAFLTMTVVTWLTLSRQSGKGELLSTNVTASLLVGTLVPAMALLVLLGRRLALRRAAETLGGTGRLHTQLVFLFSMIAAIPTLLVVIFASFLFQSGVEFWFSDNSRGMLENANKLAHGYYEQNVRDVGNESIAMASDLREYIIQAPILSPAFKEGYSYQVLSRKLNESAILQKGADGKLSTAAFIPAGSPSREWISSDVMQRIEQGEPLVVTRNANRIEAVTPIDRQAGIYLYAARSSDLLAYSQGQRAENIVRAYEMLTQRARTFQLRFNIALFVASLAIVGLAVWFALKFADRQVKPMYQLVAAARQVGSGNFSLRVEGRTGADEIGLLNRAFNRMTSQIERQTQALVSANQQLHERRAFIEAVLESVSAGVISTDGEGRIQLINTPAQQLLFERGAASPVGELLAEAVPQLSALVDIARDSSVVQYGKGSEMLTLAVKIARDTTGHVISFEDITRQVIDQRQAAWSDVARRIAHEIKNPLTPIQLATERLNRRYRKQILTDPELFEELTSTIIRQVGELRKMVDEFSSFARLPKPVFRGEDPVDLARQALFLQEVARPDIDFDFNTDEAMHTRIMCDRHQFGQAMTNVLKNAVEAVEARARTAPIDYRGKVRVAMHGEAEAIAVTVTDNGVGLPQDRDRIVEPYVTTREKGTGLGLAIVKKIIEEHGGDMHFSANENGETQVTLRFARDPLQRDSASEAAE